MRLSLPRPVLLPRPPSQCLFAIAILARKRVNHCFAFADAAKIDKDNGQYNQIGIIKYAFLD